jgi:hypothetical protein
LERTAVENLEVISGHPLLVPAALEAVKIDVNFTLVQ